MLRQISNMFLKEVEVLINFNREFIVNNLNNLKSTAEEEFEKDQTLSVAQTAAVVHAGLIVPHSTALALQTSRLSPAGFVLYSI